MCLQLQLVGRASPHHHDFASDIIFHADSEVSMTHNWLLIESNEIIRIYHAQALIVYLHESVR